MFMNQDSNRHRLRPNTCFIYYEISFFNNSFNPLHLPIKRIYEGYSPIMNTNHCKTFYDPCLSLNGICIDVLKLSKKIDMVYFMFSNPIFRQYNLCLNLQKLHKQTLCQLWIPLLKSMIIKLNSCVLSSVFFSISLTTRLQTIIFEKVSLSYKS